MQGESVTVHITAALEQQWNRLGIDSKERSEQLSNIQALCEKIYQENVNENNKKCAEIRSNIEELQKRHKQAMSAYGIPVSEINSMFKPIEESDLLRQLSAARKEYELFRIKITEQVQKIENFVIICKESYDLLETPMEERGEFASIGEADFTRDRIERFRLKVEELKTEINNRRSMIQETKKRISAIDAELADYEEKGMKKKMASTEVTITFINALSELEKRITKEKEIRLQKLNDCAVKMTHLWDILNISNQTRNEFISRYNNLSNETLSACSNEIQSLIEQQNKELPKLIEGRRKELSNLWTVLHISVESRPHFDKGSCPENEMLRNEYDFLDQELLRLKIMQGKCHPILTEIASRESIINDYRYVCDIQKDPRRLTSRGPGMAQQLIKEEKARKRYKFTLPKVEKKLHSLLKQYFKENNTHFEWDGHPYIELLSHMNTPNDNANVETNFNDTRANTLPRDKCKKLVVSSDQNARYLSNKL